MRTTAPSPPSADHPYSLVRTLDGRTGWVSGVLPYDESGAIVAGPPGAAISAVLRVLAERLAEAGASLDDVVKTTVYLVDLGWRNQLNDAFATAFRSPMPARTAVGVKDLPRGATIELDAVVQVG